MATYVYGSQKESQRISGCAGGERVSAGKIGDNSGIKSGSSQKERSRETQSDAKKAAGGGIVTGTVSVTSIKGNRNRNRASQTV
jgi:hypothetical protein